MKPGGLVALPSHTGMRALGVPSPSGVGGMLDKAARWECAPGQKTWAGDAIFN